MTEIAGIHNKLTPKLKNMPDFASILVVDDQWFDRKRLMRMCNDLDFDVHLVEAASLEAMGTHLWNDKFDLIFLDYNLPDGTGMQAIKAIRHDQKNRNAAIIMITGDGQDDLAIEALKEGCSDYITKDDLSPESFKRATINALQKSSLSIGIETQEAGRKHIEGVLQQFSSECARDIKPMVSRMMRQLRELRDAPSVSMEEFEAQQLRMEKSCMRLWEFLEDLDKYEGTDIAQEVAKPAVLLEPKKPRRLVARATSKTPRPASLPPSGRG